MEKVQFLLYLYVIVFQWRVGWIVIDEWLNGWG